MCAARLSGICILQSAVSRVEGLYARQLQRRQNKESAGRVDTLAKHTIPLEELEAADTRVKKLKGDRQAAVNKLSKVGFATLRLEQWRQRVAAHMVVSKGMAG